MPRNVSPAVFEVLDKLYELALAGQIQGFFVVAQIPRCEPQKLEAWDTKDHGDLIFEVRTSLFQLELDAKRGVSATEESPWS